MSLPEKRPIFFLPMNNGAELQRFFVKLKRLSILLFCQRLQFLFQINTPFFLSRKCLKSFNIHSEREQMSYPTCSKVQFTAVLGLILESLCHKFQIFINLGSRRDFALRCHCWTGWEEGEKHFSSAFFCSWKNGDIQRYDKQILLPIVEYIPFEWLKTLARMYGISEFFVLWDKIDLVSFKSSYFYLHLL